MTGHPLARRRANALRLVLTETRLAGNMSEHAVSTVGAPARSSERGWLATARLKLFGRRRRLLVHRAYQMRAAIRGVGGTGVLVAILGFVLYQVNGETSRDLAQMAPFMKAQLDRSDRITLFCLILGSLVFLAGVFFLEIVDSHRTAGAMLNLRRRLEELRSGRLAAHLKLRRHDHFPELNKAFNEAAASLRTRAEGEIAALSRLSSLAKEVLKEQELGNLARSKALVETLRQSLEEMRCRKGELLEP